MLEEKVTTEEKFGEIVSQPDGDFEKWYSERKEAAERQLRDHELIASIPGRENYYEDRAKSLKSALDYLEFIKSIRERRKL